jgi:hypothetical protein
MDGFAQRKRGFPGADRRQQELARLL